MNYYYMQAVKSIMPAKYREAINKDGKKPRELFTKTYKEPLKAGEKWVKDSESSFTVVGSLILSIMFTAIFTVSGGYNQATDVPILVDVGAFIVFIITAQVSLMTSFTLLMICLRILTSCNVEEDFCQKVLKKLHYSFHALFLSMVFMMVAFFAAVNMMLGGNDYVQAKSLIFLILNKEGSLF